MKCYVVSQKANYDLPNGINKENTLFFPEAGMTTNDQMNTGRPRDFNIITDSPFMVGLYSQEEVFIFKDGEWKEADFQTYGCSFSSLINNIWSSVGIARAVYDGEITNVMGSKLS